ncbi:MAG TPA: hypothetical protein VJN94_14990 [Candidatus Binataceae bacterium]|nr:hypothetical protein [Candidatus Binataceae bacterium]
MADPFRLWLGLAGGIAASVLLAAGLAMMKSRGEALPPAEGTAIPSAILRWIRDPVWIGGLAVQAIGYLLYFWSLLVAPVSLIAVMMQAGIAAFVLIAVIFLHERANAGEMAGIAGIILAMLLLALSLRSGEAQGGLDSPALGVLSAVSIVAAAAPWSVERLRRNGAAPAIASGIAFGLASLYTKALADVFAIHSETSRMVPFAASPWLYLTIVTNVVGLVLLQNSFHWARGIITMPLSSAISNIIPIFGGIAAFGESLPAAPLLAILRIAAFAITIAGGILLAGAEATAESP